MGISPSFSLRIVSTAYRRRRQRRRKKRPKKQGEEIGISPCFWQLRFSFSFSLSLLPSFGLFTSCHVGRKERERESIFQTLPTIHPPIYPACLPSPASFFSMNTAVFNGFFCDCHSILFSPAVIPARMDARLNAVYSIQHSAGLETFISQRKKESVFSHFCTSTFPLNPWISYTEKKKKSTLAQFLLFGLFLLLSFFRTRAFFSKSEESWNRIPFMGQKRMNVCTGGIWPCQFFDGDLHSQAK